MCSIDIRNTREPESVEALLAIWNRATAIPVGVVDAGGRLIAAAGSFECCTGCPRAPLASRSDCRAGLREAFATAERDGSTVQECPQGHSYATAVILTGARPTGLLMVGPPAPPERPFAEERLAVAAGLAAVIGEYGQPAAPNRVGSGADQVRAQRLQRDVAVALGAASDPREALDGLLVGITQLEGLDAGVVFLKDPATQDFLLAAHRGISAEFARLTARVPADASSVAALHAGQPLYLTESTIPGVSPRSAQIEGLRAMAILPIQHGAESIAVLVAGSHRQTSVPPEARDALEAIAAQIGGALARARVESAFRRASLVIENSPVILFRWQASDGWPVEYVSENVALLGYTPAELMAPGFRYDSLIAPEDRERIARLTDAYAHGDVHAFRLEYRVTTKSGMVRWVDERTVIERDDAGEPTNFQGVLLDITERMEAVQALRRAKDDAEAANRALEQTLARANSLALEAERASAAKSEFLASMSHEIRTPLNGVIGMTGLLLDTELTAEQRDLAQTARTAGEVLLSLINDILDFSKIEAGKCDLEYSDLDLRAITAEVVEMLAYRAREKQLALTWEVADEIPMLVRGDPGRLRQILINLAGNAIKFTDHGSITLRASRVPRGGNGVEVRYEVSDTGIGIAPEHQHLLFQSFSQTGPAASRPGGTGLGLAISKRLVELMKGQMGATSEPGRGSTFWFTVVFASATCVEQGERIGGATASQERPTTSKLLSRSNAAAGSGSSAAARGSDTGRSGSATVIGRALRILLAEDNLINQKVALKMLEQLGHRVECVADGRDAVHAAGQSVFDLIFMDCQMPGMDGHTATREIRARERERRTPIIAMTAHAMKGYREICLETGMDDYVAKPIRPQELGQAIERCLLQPAGSPSVRPVAP